MLDFYRKWRLGPDQIHYNHSRLWSRLHNTLAQMTWITSKWIYAVLIFSPWRIFEQLCAFPEKESCPEIFHCMYWIYFLHSGFFSNLRLPWNFWLYWMYFLHLGFLSNLRFPWKTECDLKFFTVLNIFFVIQDFEQLALALKNREYLENFHCIEYIFTFRIFEQLALVLKNRVALKFLSVSKYYLSFRIFEQLALALKNKVCPGIFHCIEIFCTILDFWATCTCPKKRVCPDIFKARGRPPSPTNRFVHLCRRLLTLGTL